MRQKARVFGVLANPYRVIEPGDEFDHPERMNWADPVEAEPVENTDPAPRRGRRKVQDDEPSETDPI